MARLCRSHVLVRGRLQPCRLNGFAAESSIGRQKWSPALQESNCASAPEDFRRNLFCEASVLSPRCAERVRASHGSLPTINTWRACVAVAPTGNDARRALRVRETPGTAPAEGRLSTRPIYVLPRKNPGLQPNIRNIIGRCGDLEIGLSRSLEVMRSASAACSAYLALFQRMPAQPSGLITDRRTHPGCRPSPQMHHKSPLTHHAPVDAGVSRKAPIRRNFW